jgi:hypothetical protein
VTLTLAALYEKQGLVGRAREIYRRLADSPDEATAAAARRKLAELPSSAEAHIALLSSLLERIAARRRSR